MIPNNQKQFKEGQIQQQKKQNTLNVKNYVNYVTCDART